MRIYVSGHAKKSYLNIFKFHLWISLELIKHIIDQAKEKIVEVQSFDSPGFTEDFVTSQAYLQMEEKRNLLWKFCFVN